jgi:hypothetical protein
MRQRVCEMTSNAHAKRPGHSDKDRRTTRPRPERQPAHSTAYENY